MKQCPRLLAFVLLLILCTAATAWSVEPVSPAVPSASASAPLGSAKFKPSPDSPLGWRGDGTGRYPGATPPQTWSRRVADSAITNARYQARKPKKTGKPADSLPLELGIIKDWLVLGPFPTDDPQADIEKPFIANEASITPDENDKAGGLTWKLLHATIDTQSTHYTNEGTCQDYNIDFIYLYGQLNNQVAYAHTYIYSPTGGNVQLSIHRAGAAAKIWINGQSAVMSPNDWDHIYKANGLLMKGWNRLLVKLSCAEGTKPEGQNPWVSKWRFSTYLSAPLPAEYATKNIAWMTKLPGFSASAPVVVGSRIFTTCGTSDLLCVNKQDGRILWMTTCTPCDAMSAADKSDADYQQTVAPLAEELEQADRNLVQALNSVNGLHGLPTALQEGTDTLIKNKHELEKKLHDALRKIDRRKYVPLYGNEVSGTNGTPCTDGQHVYVAVGGGMKGPGAYVIAAYDLNGRRIWSFHEALGASEHGNHISPALVDGKLIYAANTTLLALDAQTGAVAWRNKLPQDAQNSCSCMFVPTKIGETSVLLAYPSDILRASDGKILSHLKLDNETFFSGLATPVVENGVLYTDGGVFKKVFHAVQLPEAIDGAMHVAWKLDGAQWRLEKSSGFSIASSIVANGLYYTVDTMGALTAIDPATHEAIYTRRIEMYQRASRQVYGFAASPILGGKNLYFFDNTGCCLLLEPQRDYKEVARNIIENQVASDWQDYKQELFYASPVCDGSAMYLKGSEYLYCIGNTR